YDALGRRASMDDPDSGTWTYGYDDAGNVTAIDDPKLGQHLVFGYDALGRVTSKGSASADGVAPAGQTTLATYAYDIATNGKGGLASVTDASGSRVVAAYDVRGGPTTSTQTIHLTTLGNQTVTRTFTTLRSYDALGRLATMTYPYPDGDGR